MLEFIDLSLPIIDKEKEPQAAKIIRMDHKQGAAHATREENFVVKDIHNAKGKFDSNSFPDGEFLSYEVVQTGVHTGTHMDAPYHYGSQCEGNIGKYIADVPLQYCFGPGLKLDVRGRKNNDLIDVKDIKNACESAGSVPNQDTIVLIQTGFDQYFGSDEYFLNHPGLSLEALQWILSFGVKTIGIDTFSFDKPFKKMVKEYLTLGNAEHLWPTHFWGRHQEYFQIEALAFLDKIPVNSGFWVSCFPIKIHKAGAGWVRAVALYDRTFSIFKEEKKNESGNAN